MSPDAKAGERASPAELVFVGGFGSGGTDLLMNVLNGHGDIFIPGEFPFLASLADRYGSAVPEPEVGELIDALRKADAYRTFMHHHWDNFVVNRHEPVDEGPLPPAVDGRYTVSTIYQWLLGIPPHVRWTGNKTPANTQNIARLRRLFPRARFILIVRDVRDVVVSWKRRWHRDPLLTAEKYRRRMLSGFEQAQKLEEGAVLLIRYEDLLDDFEAQCTRICDFLALELDPQMLRFHEHVNRSFRSKPNYHQPLLPGNYGKWRRELPPAVVRRVEEIALPAMTAYGYTPALASSGRPITLWERLQGRVHDVYGTVAVNNRFEGQHPVLRTVKSLAFAARKATTQRSVVK